MAHRNTLELINDVYANLREDPISAITTDYDRLILSFINQAKERVEDAWQWRALRQTTTWTSQVGKTKYDLTRTLTNTGDADDGSPVWLPHRTQLYHDPRGRPLVFDRTAKMRLQQVPYWYGVEQQVFSPPHQQPYQVFFDSTGVNFVAPPSVAGRQYSVAVVIPQARLSGIADILEVPATPVVLLATAWAVNERGEELGNRPILPQSVLTTDWASEAEHALARSIALDSTFDSTELVMDAGQITR